jgi:hypothetical protein
VLQDLPGHKVCLDAEAAPTGRLLSVDRWETEHTKQQQEEKVGTA